MGNRLYVGNLSFNTTDQTLQEAFAACGEVVDVKVVTDRETGRSRGFGFVSMRTDSEAQAAIEAFDGRDLDGRTLRVNEAEERPARSGGGGGGGGGFGGGGGGGGGGFGGRSGGFDRGGDRGGDRGFDRGGDRGGDRNGGGSRRGRRW